MKITVEFDHQEERTPKCIARLVSGHESALVLIAAAENREDHEAALRARPTAEDYAREGHGENPVEALEDLLLGDLREGLRRAFVEEAST